MAAISTGRIGPIATGWGIYQSTSLPVYQSSARVASEPPRFSRANASSPADSYA